MICQNAIFNAKYRYSRNKNNFLQVPPPAPNKNKANPEKSEFVLFFTRACLKLLLHYKK